MTLNKAAPQSECPLARKIENGHNLFDLLSISVLADADRSIKLSDFFGAVLRARFLSV
jgi:hypothetical protein